MVLLIVMSYCYDYRRIATGRSVCFWGMLVVFVLVAGLRYHLGQDTIVYIGEYEKLHPINQLSSMDFSRSRYAPGYIVLCAIFRSFGPEFTVFQFFHSLFVNCVVFLFLRKNTRHLFFALFLFFIYMYFALLFQQMRESIAVSIFLLAWPAFRERKWIWWYLAATLAATFHVSAFMMFILPVICIPGIRWIFIFSKRTIIICFFVLLGGILLGTAFFKYIQLIAVTESMVERATLYSKSELSGLMLNFNGIVGKVVQSILYPLLAMLFLYYKQKQTGEPTNYKFRNFEMIAVVSIYVSIFAIPIPIVSRFNNYFYLFALVILSDWAFTVFPLLGKKVRLHYLYWIMLFTPMIGLQLYNTYLKAINPSGTLKGYMVYYPYSSYLDQTIDADREKAFRYITR